MALTEQQLDARLDLVPMNPGVYLMKDASGSVIYVGKAIVLRNRLRSYFTINPQGNAKVLAMISHIADFDFIVCANELEALILEANLIKQHQPHYNILLRDDKGYPYIRITMNEEYPRLLKAFRVGEDRKAGARYFGPYLAGDLYRALEVLRHIFPTKTCRRVLPRDIGKERPCLNYYIGRCVGPCKGDVPVQVYRDVMTDICRFLEGKYSGILDELTDRMSTASERLDFELAALTRDRIAALNRLMNQQKAVSTREDDRDILGIFRNGSEICLQKIEVREGRMIGSAAFFLPDEGQEDPDVIRAFILQHYPETTMIPPEILIPADLPDQTGMEEYLQTARQKKCRLHRPQRGPHKQMLNMAAENAEQSLRRHTLLGGSGHTALQVALQELSGLTSPANPVHRVEAYDISNTGSADMAASMVVFLDGKPQRQQYRHFQIKQVEGTDDYQAMREVLRRRLNHLSERAFGQKPDLILVDGGLGHVHTARQVLLDLDLEIPVAGMVKDQKHRTRGLALPDGQIIELKRAAADTGFVAGGRAVGSRYSARTGAPGVSGYPVRAGCPGGPDSPAQACLSNEAADSGPADEEEMLWRVAERSADYDAGRQAAEMGLLRLLTAIQDEAHRFALSYNRNLMKKRHTRFALEEIKGVGPAKRRLLLQHFQTIRGVSEASLAQLLDVHDLGRPAAEAVFSTFSSERRSLIHGCLCPV